MECKTDQARRQKVVIIETRQPAPIQDYSMIKSSSKVATAVQNMNTSEIVTNETIQSSDQFDSGEENKIEVEHDCEDVEQEKTKTGTTNIILSTETDSDIECKVQNALKDKVKEVEILSSKLSSCEALCGDITEENEILSREKGELTSRLEKELEERVKHLDEKTELVDRVEEYSKQIKEANKGKNKAVKELRALIEQQDKLRQELTMFREQSGNAEAELIIVRQELAKFNRLKDQVKNFVDVLGFQRNFLEAAKSKVDKFVAEKISPDDEKAELKRKLKELVTVNQNLEIAVENLKKDKKELVHSLDNVARNVSRNVPQLAEEKNDKAAGSQDGSGKMRSLEEQVAVLTNQLGEAKLAMSMNQQLFSFGTSSQDKKQELVTCQEEQLKQIAGSGRETDKQEIPPVSCHITSTNNLPCRETDKQEIPPVSCHIT